MTRSVSARLFANVISEATDLRFVCCTPLFDVSCRGTIHCVKRGRSIWLAADPACDEKAWLRAHTGQACKRHGQFLLVVSLITQFAREVLLVGAHVEVPMAAQVEQDGFRASFALAA